MSFSFGAPSNSTSGGGSGGGSGSGDENKSTLPFSFGAASTSSNSGGTTTTTPFSFGAAPSTTTAGTPASVGFAFGASAGSSTGSTTSTSSFNGNGNKQATTTSTTTTTNAGNGGGFSFGGGNSSQQTSSTSPTPPTFAFGSAAPMGGNTPVSSFAFGTAGANPGNSSTQTPFSIGGNTVVGATGAAGDKTTPATAPFSFGGGSIIGGEKGSEASTSSTTFGFGAPAPANSNTNTNTTTGGDTGGFSFGSAPTTANQVKNTTGTTTTATGESTFAFGGFGAKANTNTTEGEGVPFTTPGGTEKRDRRDAAETEPLHNDEPFKKQNNNLESGGFRVGAPAATTGDQNRNEQDTTTKQTDGASRPVEQPLAGQGFGGSFSMSRNSGTSAPPTPATPARPPQTPAMDPPKLEYQTLTVEQIINKFQQELEKDALLYLDEAKRIAEYDAILRDAQRDIAKLTQQTQRTIQEQEEVNQTLTSIELFQQELERTLETVEKNVDELFSTKSQLPPIDADVEREKAYSTARSVEQRLQSLSESLRTTLEEIDAAQERVLTGDVGKIVQILNQHDRTLAEVKDAAGQMEIDLGHVNKLLTRR